MLKISRPKGAGLMEFRVGDAAPFTSKFGSKAKRKELAGALGVEVTWLADCVAARLADRSEAEMEFPLARPAAPVEPPQPVSVRIRGRSETSDNATSYATLRDALAAADLPDEAMIEWKDARLCALDVDFHGAPFESRPLPEYLDRIGPRVEPSPVFYWSTHGRGFRFLYEARDGYTAKELAAAAFLSTRRLWPGCDGELILSTRHPKSLRDGRACGPIRTGNATADMSELRCLLLEGGADAVVIDEWLAVKELKRGGQYPHTKCVIDPSSSGGRDPVRVREDGIYCHYCAHTTGKGFRPYSQLCGDHSATMLGVMVRGRCHWGHAKYLMESVHRLRGEIAEQCYAVALKMDGADEDLVKAVFAKSPHLVRLDGFWSKSDGHAYTTKVDAILAELPATCGNQAKVAELLQTGQLDRFGYTALKPVWGARIATHHGSATVPDPTWRQPDIVFYPPELRSESMRAYRPRYVPSKGRDLEAAWRRLETAFPGLNRPYIRLLIAAKGCVEAEGAMPPMIWVSGPTGAAKTAGTHIAAAICGDSVSSPVWHRDPDKTRQGILAAKGTGSFCVFDEVLKEGADQGRKPISTMNFLLNVTPQSTSHKLYTGAVPLGWVPVLVFTDTTLPQDVSDDAQLARRLTAVRMDSQTDWIHSLISTGVKVPKRARVASEDFAEACNVILSDVIDEYFSEPPLFARIAEHLGFRSILDQERDPVRITLRAFFTAVCDAPDGSGRPWQTGEGWKHVDMNHETPLANLWAELHDREDQTASRQCSSQDWQKILDTPKPVKFEVRSYGNRVLVRFTSDGRHNGDIVRLESVASCADRPRDPVGGRFDVSGFAGLPGPSFDAADEPRGEGVGAMGRVDPTGPGSVMV